jgi:hypothetical protein
MAFRLQLKHRVHLSALLAAVTLLVLSALYAPTRKAPAATQDIFATPTAPKSEALPSVARPAPAAPSDVRAEGRRADRLAAKSIEQIASVIRDHIARSPRYAELAKCDSVVSLPCRELLSQAIYEAMHLKVLPETIRGGMGVKDLSRHDADALFDTAGRVLIESTDSVERASALLLLSSIPSLPGRALPEAAYRNLSERTVAESQLTLQQTLGGPLPYPEAVRELVSLFTNDRDSRLQDAALSALAFPETEPELLAAVRETARKHGPEWPDWLQSVAPAIGTCGMACIETVNAVLDASGDAPAVAEEMLRAFPERDRVELTRHMRSRFEPDALLALATSAGVELSAAQ